MSADAVHGRGSLATVVIVNCNYEKFVAAAIDSALEQAYEPLEVIVVDDGSTDGSRRIISAYGGRIRTIFQTNSGQGAAYNAGWSAARGEFVLFLDSDDALMKDAMTKIVAAFQRSDAVKVQFYLQQVDRDLKPLGHVLPSYNFTRIEPRDQIANYGYYVSPLPAAMRFEKAFSMMSCRSRTKGSIVSPPMAIPPAWRTWPAASRPFRKRWGITASTATIAAVKAA
jgi:glycosyltransferase involved in cell wall biosynthesis